MGTVRGEGEQGVAVAPLKRPTRKKMENRPNMGEIASEHPDLWGPVSKFYELQNEFAFDDLLTHISELVSSEQEEPLEGEPALVERRAGIFAAANALKRQAALMLVTYNQMRADIERLHALARNNDGLLEAVFNVETRVSTGGFRSEKLDILFSFDSAVDEQRLREWLQAVEGLSVREQLQRGRIANSLLRNCVAACRDYWITAERRSWSMSSLKQGGKSKPAKHDELKGECETFVADLLAACSLRFSLDELATAWTVVDRDARRASA